MHAVVDKDARITDMVVTNLAEIYCGKKSRIFTSRNKELVKEVLVRDQTNFDCWMPRERDPTEYEQVSKPTSVEELNEIHNLHKDERAPGVDGLMSLMLKSSRTLY